ncbi:MAG: Flp pilus assembly protein CpaB [Myxococcales bacterium 68-20]|nr:Flp pilus assembly protein CpaB [Myxococcales bacterium]OJY16868.1 MAG: Flp pilus assembly protein CpaB [Myxococcales bacterium 68-20]
MNRRALFIAVLVGILGAFLLVLYQRRFELEASGGEKVKLLMAVKRIERGKPITDDVITIREIPLAYVDERAIRETEKNKILGLKMGNTVKEQQVLLWSDLTATDERKDLSALVLPGYRAVSIKAARDDTSIALIKPGDYVDVIGVIGASTAINEAKNAVVLLQRVLVLATGTDTSPEQAKDTKEANPYASENLLTLSLTLTEAQVLALAAERGRLAVAVRHPDDQARTSGIVDLNFNQIVDERERAKIRNVRTGPRDITAPGQPQ